MTHGRTTDSPDLTKIDAKQLDHRIKRFHRLFRLVRDRSYEEAFTSPRERRLSELRHRLQDEFERSCVESGRRASLAANHTMLIW